MVGAREILQRDKSGWDDYALVWGVYLLAEVEDDAAAIDMQMTFLQLDAEAQRLQHGNSGNPNAAAKKKKTCSCFMIHAMGWTIMHADDGFFQMIIISQSEKEFGYLQMIKFSFMRESKIL